MSTQLPKALRLQAMDPFRTEDGHVRCAVCMKPFAEKDIQVDHIKPEHLDGSHELSNLQPLCYPKGGGPSCHKDKSAAEAKARARDRARASRSPLLGTIVLILFGSTLFMGWICWLMWTDASTQPFLDATRKAIHWYSLALAALGLLYAVAHWHEGKEPHRAPAQVAASPTGQTPEQRIAGAVRAEMGTEGTVKVSPYKVDGRPGFKITYRGTNFSDHDPNARLKVLNRLSAKTGHRMRCDWNQEEDMFFAVPRPALSKRINHPGIAKGLPWHQIPIGPSTTIDLKVTPHVLVIGGTLAGKTSLFRSIVIALGHASVTQDVRLFLIDPKRVELIGFRGWPGITSVVTDEEEMYDLPGVLLAEMERRYALFENEKVPLSSHQPWVMIIDEYEDYYLRMEAWSLESKRRKTKSEPIQPIRQNARLLAMARRCKIHLIIGTQRPDASWFGGSARDNCQGRIGVGPLSADASRMLFKDSTQGRDIPAELKGRFTIQMNEGGYQEDQAYWTPDATDADGENTEQDWALLERLGMPRRATA